jgi:hypothetical protein
VLAIVTQVGAVASAVGAVLGIVFVLLPGLKPEPPPAAKSAALTKIALERDVSYSQYLQRVNLPPGDTDEARLARRGVFVQFNVEIVGYKGKELPLRWSLYDAQTGEQVRASESVTLEAEATSDSASWHFWSPLPRGRGPFYFLLQLFDEGGVVPIDRAQTDLFRGAA